MLRVNEMLVTAGMFGNAAVRLRTASGARAGGAVAVLIAGSLFGLPLWAQTSVPIVRSADTQAATTAPASSATKSTKPGKKRVVSPYARAAAQHAHVGEASMGHAPTTVQGIGKTTHKPHAATPRT
jgi:hypothetical protein